MCTRYKEAAFVLAPVQFEPITINCCTFACTVEGVATELEVPNHPEATIRLHKARIKSLTSEVTAAQNALKDK